MILDEEKYAREAVMEQLPKILTGASGSKFAPSLRFLALVSLCQSQQDGLSL